MESKKRLSLDGPREGASPSALRRLTRSPTHRLLRRSSSVSSSSSSAVSVASDDGEASPSSCVTRDTARDECALYRFIVWAAVKRNECGKMTPEEKRECPLLRCRKRFPNHEFMLQHLYTCDQLALGEYWCYNCEKVERFSDAKCKRCLGHPSRRRKIVSMAKNFFSSLGHKNKNSPLADYLDLDEAPPSYDDSLLCPPQQEQVELYSTEIHEIDSSEIPLPTILEDADEAETDAASVRLRLSVPVPTPVPTPAVPSLPIEPLPVRPVELESAPIFNEPFLAWPSLPDTVAPTNLMSHGGNTSQERPVLQLHTSDLDQYRAQVKKRSKMLAPSTSVRSTASTSSTNSTNSTSSTASYNISPMSAWSGAWTKVAGFESTLTSPADDHASPGGLFRNNSFLIPDKPSKYHGYDCDNGTSDPFFSELPADIPMMDANMPSDNPQDNLGLDQTVFSLDTSMSADLSLESNLVLTDASTMPPPMPRAAVTEPVPTYSVRPRSLIDTAWDALEMHVVQSMAKLQRMTKNHLVNQLRNMSTHSIAMDGLATLTEILQGQRPTSPVKLLCFVHVIYSFSLVVHEQDAPNRWSDLFGQAMSYSAWFSRQDRQLYVQIVDALWKPAAMTTEEVVSLVRAKTSVSRSSSLKGKEPETISAHQASQDSLAFVAQYFLDHDPEIQTSPLCMQHLGDIALDVAPSTPYGIAVEFVLKYGFQTYAVDHPRFQASLDEILERSHSSYGTTTRRLELELMNAGKIYLPSDVFFDSFISSVRAQIDQLYAQNVSNISSRTIYYEYGVKLMEGLINTSQLLQGQLATTEAASRTPNLDSLDDVIGAMTPNHMDGFDFSSVGDFNTTPQVNFHTPMTIAPDSLSNPQLMPTPEGTVSLGGPSTAATSPPSPAPGQALSKVESDSCCGICGYRPKGDPRWFGGSMAKHKKLQHATTPPKIYKCPFPGCTSQYKNRPDNLRQHQIEKNHWLEGQEPERRPSKRKKVE
ncbi:hypothetical protein B0T10DRAFT_455596 [Thelonectria olida]|uniref:Uncharacterized protein n=1 Tax=Thelonectria olida TaxID=1576542 RepID=A0A9P8WDZ4_9HYPO|nr:hypothetical protein B0T10DRAFT_455596 [Thelonectria olida]